MRNALLGIILCLFASAVNADDNFEAVKAQLIADNPTVDFARMSYDNNILILHFTQISDISALSGLTALESLHLQNTPVSDISALSGLIALETLVLTDTQISDISALSGLTALKELYLYGTEVRDVSAIQHMIDGGLSIGQ